MNRDLKLKENHRFKGIDSDYLFQTDTLNLFRLDDMTADVIEKIDKSGINALAGLADTYGRERLDERMKLLFKAGLFDSGAEKAEPEKVDVQPGSINRVVLYAAENCNLKCRYCFSDSHKVKDNSMMSWDTAKRAVDMLLEDGKEHERFIVAFFGGEPLLNFPVIEKTVNYMEDRVKALKKKVSFSITTNGTLLTADIADFLIDHDFFIAYSIDGGEETHDANRIYQNGDGSFRDVAENYRILKAKGADVIAQAVISDVETDLNRIAEELQKEGIVHYKLMHCFDETGEMAFSEETMKNFRKANFHLMEKQLQKFDQKKSALPQQLFSLFQRINRHGRMKHSCSALTDQIAIGADGSVYPCENFVHNQEFRLGDVDNGYSRKLIGEFNSAGVENGEKCVDCWARYICGGPCPYFSYIGSGKFNSPSDSSCDAKRAELEAGLAAYGYSKYRDSDFLNKWIEERNS